MLQKGLTGNIGSGKSLVANIFRVLGVPVFDADLEGKNILDDPGIHDQLKALFGEEIFTKGKPDRKAVAGIVFSDKEKLENLNGIIHPAVREKFTKWSQNFNHLPYVIYEAAIILETGRAAHLDGTIVVTAPRETRIDRVMRRDGISRDLIEQRMKNQWTEEKKCSMADYLIDNSGEHMLIPQVIRTHNEILKKSGSDQFGE